MDFWANVELQNMWTGESLQSGDYECKLEQFIMPNNVESFNVLDLHTNKSVGFIEVVMQLTDARKAVHTYSNVFHLPHRNWKVAEVISWINDTVRNTWADMYTYPIGGRSAFGDLLVDYLCTGEVVQSSEFVQWNTHPDRAEVVAHKVAEMFSVYKRPSSLGSLSKLWLLVSAPLRVFLGDRLSGFIAPPPVANDNASYIERTCVWHVDFGTKTHPFIHFTKSTVPGPITSIVVRSNIVVGEEDLNELCRCIVPENEYSAIQLGLSTGTVWKRVKASASLKAIHLVVTADDGRRMPFTGGVLYYLLHFRPC